MKLSLETSDIRDVKVGPGSSSYLKIGPETSDMKVGAEISEVQVDPGISSDVKVHS